MPFVWLIPLAMIVATAIAAGFFAHPIETPPPSPTTTLEPTVLAAQTIEPTSTSSPSPYQGEGQGEVSQQGSSISFLDLPSTLSAGQKTKITIKIDGPAGTKGDNAKIKVKYHASEEKQGSSSLIKTDTSNSFGSFATPATFSMNLSLDQEKAPVELTASAEIDGKIIETSRTVTLN